MDKITPVITWEIWKCVCTLKGLLTVSFILIALRPYDLSRENFIRQFENECSMKIQQLVQSITIQCLFYQRENWKIDTDIDIDIKHGWNELCHVWIVILEIYHSPSIFHWKMGKVYFKWSNSVRVHILHKWQNCEYKFRIFMGIFLVGLIHLHRLPASLLTNYRNYWATAFKQTNRNA